MSMLSLSESQKTALRKLKAAKAASALTTSELNSLRAEGLLEKPEQTAYEPRLSVLAERELREG